MQNRLSKEFYNLDLFKDALEHGLEYIVNIKNKEVYPNQNSLKLLKNFDHSLSKIGVSAQEILEKMRSNGTPNTIAQIGGKYFGFVNGGAIPATLICKTMTDIWDQCGGLNATSPINAKLEEVCEKWLVDLLGLPPETKAGFVSGTSMANLSALTAARYHILKRQGWNINQKGLNGAPRLRIIANSQAHASIKKTLTILGLGLENIEWVKANSQGKVSLSDFPKIDKKCIVLLQAGNVNSGSFDDFEDICTEAQKHGAWVHIDGAFGLWAEASATLKHLTKGINLADSWAVDGHKTLNTPYDNGIVLCKHEESLITSLQATGEYLIYSDKRDPILYGPEMSKRSRAIELWSAMMSLGEKGIDEMVTGFHERAMQFAKGLSEAGFEICNDVVFNQVLLRYKDDPTTKRILEKVQNSGKVWMGGSIWHGQSVIRISVCSWLTTEEDVEEVIQVFKDCKCLI